MEEEEYEWKMIGGKTRRERRGEQFKREEQEREGGRKIQGR